MLITILTVSAVALLIATTVSLLAIGQAQSGFSVTNGEIALALTEGCMEDALQNIKNSPTYAGGTITRPEGTCIITVTKSGNIWTTTATTTETGYRRTIKTVIARSWRIQLLSWKE